MGYDYGKDTNPTWDVGDQFEGTSHEAMIEMVKNANPTELIQRGNALDEAQKKMTQIAKDLQKHIQAVDWVGEAGTAFREWGMALSESVAGLALYTAPAAYQMESAGQTLSEVQKAMPPVPEDAKMLRASYTGVGPVMPRKPPTNVPKAGQGPVSAVQAGYAQYELDHARGEAIVQMNKLAYHYGMSADVMSGQVEPKFPKMPDAVHPGVYIDDSQSWSPGSGGSGVGKSAGVASAAVKPGGTTGTGKVSGSAGTASVVPSAPGRITAYPEIGSGAVPDASTEIDSVAAIPSHQNVVATGTTSPGAGGSGSPAVVQPPFVSGGILPGTGAGATGGMPRNLPPLGAGRAVAGGVSAVGGNRQVSGAGNGIVGGRPVGSSRPANQIPRGNVVGEEESATRSPMGRGGFPSGGVGSASEIGAGPSSGRRLASERGGVVGGERTPASGQREFTPGGSGLHRNREDADSTARDRRLRGKTGSGSNSGPEDDPHSHGQRSDYLDEDEDTWRVRRPDVVPPVIE